MQRLEVSGAVRPIYGSLGVKRLTELCFCDVCRCQIGGKQDGGNNLCVTNVVRKEDH